MKNQNILISGAGIAGPSLAYWLLRYGFTPILIEHAPVLRTGGYMIDFWGVGWDVAQRMGLIPQLQQDGYHMDEIKLVNDAGHRVARINGKVYEAATGGQFVSILRGDLARSIYSLLNGKVETIFGDSIQSLQQDENGVDVTFTQSPPRRFDLVIGADGLHSTVRALAFGEEKHFAHPLGYWTASFTVTGYPYREESCSYLSYCAPGCQVARYSLRGGRTAFFFVFIPPSNIDVPHDSDQQKQFLQQVYADAGWECPLILDFLDSSTDFFLDSVSQVRMDRWSQGRIALVGDACFCPSLLAGQGSAFAMAGAYLLATEFHRAAGDHLQAFARYQTRFKPFLDKKQNAAIRFGGWFAPRTRLGIHVRNIVTNLMNAPFLSTWLARRFFADRFELPAPQSALEAS